MVQTCSAIFAAGITVLMLNFSAAQHLCTALFERQRVGVPRIVHIQHGGAVAVDGDGFGLVRVVGEMLIVAAFKALVLIIAAALLRTGCNIGGRERSSYAVADVIGVLIPEYDGKSGSALFPVCREAERILNNRHCFRNLSAPTSKCIAGLLRISYIDRRAIAGIDGFHAIAAVEIEVDQIIIAIILDFDHRAFVTGDFYRSVILQRIKAGIMLFQRFADCVSGVTVPDLRIAVLRIFIVGNVLEKMLNAELYNGGRIFNREILIRLNVLTANGDFRMFSRISHYHRALNDALVGAASHNCRRPRVSNLLILIIDIVDGNGERLGVGFLAAVVGRGGVVYRGGVGESGRGDIRRQVICRGSVRSRGLFHGLRGDDDRLAYRLGLGDDGGGLWSLRRSGDGRFVRDLHRDGVGVNRLFGCAGDAAADVRRAAVQQVRHKCVANFQLRAGSTGNIRPDVAADLDLPLIVAGQAARSERLLFIFRNGNCIHSDILAVDHKLRVRSGGGDEGGGHEAEGKSAAEKQR